MKERVAAAIVAGLLIALLVAVLVAPVVLRGQAPTSLEFLVAAGELLGVGFVLRTRSAERVRSIGFALLILGLLAMGGALAATVLAMQGTT